MKFISFLLLLYIVGPSVFAQELPPGDRPPRHIQRKMDELEKIKLLEVLQADEETTVRFFSRRKDFMDKMRNFEETKDQKLDDLSNLLNNGNNEELKKKIGEIQGLESDISQARIKYISSLSDILNFQQIAKVLIFERNFKEELRAMILKERKRRK